MKSKFMAEGHFLEGAESSSPDSESQSPLSILPLPGLCFVALAAQCCQPSADLVRSRWFDEGSWEPGSTNGI